MARGIITVKAGSGTSGGTTKGRILLIEQATPTTDGLGTGSTGGDGSLGGSSSGSIGDTGSTIASDTVLPAGTYATYTEASAANVGDIVNFDVDSSANASGLKTAASGTLYTGTITDNINVGSGQSAVVSAANFDGKITVNGGFLVVINNTKAEGKIESLVNGSFVFMDSCTHEGKIEVTGSSKTMIQNSTVEGKISSSGNLYASVTNSIIKGKLEILNATDCFVCKNTVEGETNVPNCRSCS